MELIEQLILNFAENGWQVERVDNLADLSLGIRPKLFQESVEALNPTIKAREITELQISWQRLAKFKNIARANQQFVKQLQKSQIKVINWSKPSFNNFRLTVVKFGLSKKDWLLIGWINGLPLLAIRSQANGAAILPFESQLQLFFQENPHLSTYLGLLILVKHDRISVGNVQLEWENFVEWFSLGQNIASSDLANVVELISQPEYLLAIIKNFSLSDLWLVFDQKMSQGFLKTPTQSFILQE